MKPIATSIYRKEAAEPYIVPFKSYHPRHVFNNIIDCALMRAVRYSSTISAYNEEQRSIKLMLLYNGFVLSTTFFCNPLFHFSAIVIHQDTYTIDS